LNGVDAGIDEDIFGAAGRVVAETVLDPTVSIPSPLTDLRVNE
jgi:hypothetical protein